VESEVGVELQDNMGAHSVSTAFDRRRNYGIYFSSLSSEKMGNFRKTSTKTLRGKQNTGRGAYQPNVADTKRRGKAR